MNDSLVPIQCILAGPTWQKWANEKKRKKKKAVPKFVGFYLIRFPGQCCVCLGSVRGAMYPGILLTIGEISQALTQLPDILFHNKNMSRN